MASNDQLDMGLTDEIVLENSNCDSITDDNGNSEYNEDSILPPPMPNGTFRTNAIAPRDFHTRAMPYLHNSHSTFDQHSALSKISTRGCQQGKQVFRSRIEEFEALLEDL